LGKAWSAQTTLESIFLHLSGDYNLESHFKKWLQVTEAPRLPPVFFPGLGTTSVT